jgi:hypothetical protein
VTQSRCCFPLLFRVHRQFSHTYQLSQTLVNNAQ